MSDEMFDWLLPKSETGKAAKGEDAPVENVKPGKASLDAEDAADEAEADEEFDDESISDDDFDEEDDDFGDEDLDEDDFDDDEEKAADDDDEDLPVIEINSDENADWMRELEKKRKAEDPEYMTDAEIHEALAKGWKPGEPLKKGGEPKKDAEG